MHIKDHISTIYKYSPRMGNYEKNILFDKLGEMKQNSFGNIKLILQDARRRGNNINKSIQGETPFARICAERRMGQNQVDIIEAFLQNGATPICIDNTIWGISPLGSRSYQGDTRSMKLIIEWYNNEINSTYGAEQEEIRTFYKADLESSLRACKPYELGTDYATVTDILKSELNKLESPAPARKLKK